MTKCHLADILWQVALPLGPCPILDLLSLMPEQLTCWVYTLLAWREGATPSSHRSVWCAGGEAGGEE